MNRPWEATSIHQPKEQNPLVTMVSTILPGHTIAEIQPKNWRTAGKHLSSKVPGWGYNGYYGTSKEAADEKKKFGAKMQRHHHVYTHVILHRYQVHHLLARISPSSHGGFLSHGGTPLSLVHFSENPNLKWMMTGYIPLFQQTTIWQSWLVNVGFLPSYIRSI